MKSEVMRLPTGGLIDRSQVLKFRFNGKELSGFQGDTLASALMANRIDVLSRSFKYHRPRGLQGNGYADISSLIQLAGDESAPNVLASVTSLREGLEAHSVNCWPSVGFDLGSVLQWFSPVLPSGFYYKTFMWPHWHWFEPMIRKAAGFGNVPDQDSGRQHESRYYHCDVLIVGAGPTGLMSSLVLARSNAKVVLVDDMLRPGGMLLDSRATLNSVPAVEWVDATVAELDSMNNVLRLQNATAWGYYEGNMVTVMQRSPLPREIAGRNWKIWAKTVLLATGAIERPIIFENNDLPGVMNCSAVSRYINSHAVAPGERAVVFLNNDSAYQILDDLKFAGIEPCAVVDVRNNISDEITRKMKQMDIELLSNCFVRKAKGRTRVRGVVVTSRNSDANARTIDCDLVCVSGGWNPLVHLFSQSRGTIRYSNEIAGYVPNEPMQETAIAGAVTGKFSLRESLADGTRAGNEIARQSGFEMQAVAVPEIANIDEFDYAIEACWTTDNGEKRRKSFVDLAGDVTVSDLMVALREGYGEIEHLKRYTTTGMGLDQGKTANVNAIGIIENHLNLKPEEVGTTTFRPPYAPVEFGAIAGSRFGSTVVPYRHTPMTAWHKQANAVMYEAGAQWRRPGYYIKPNETMQDAVQRECSAVRNEVGIYDGSPLGKFELKGPDVCELLDLVYTNLFGALKEQQGRYGIMLTEDGLIFDDGVVFRLDEEHYLMTSSTGNAPAVQAKLDKLIHVERPDLSVSVIPLTTQWANATVCGPKTRELLQSAQTDIDFSRESLPFMRMTEGHIDTIPVRVFRVSFTGELSFEINTPWRFGLKLWEYLMKLGENFGICPVGSEANHVLRVEKGFISLAHEVDGTVDPIDLGMSWMISKKKTDFIGKRAMEIRRANGRPRRELVGLLPENPDEIIPEGAPVTIGIESVDSDGFVSASVQSIVAGRSIALGLLVEGRARMGETVFARVRKKVIRATVVPPIFYDPEGEKLRM